MALLGAVLTVGYRTAVEPGLDSVPADVAAPAREGVANAVAAADGLGARAEGLV